MEQVDQHLEAAEGQGPPEAEQSPGARQQQQEALVEGRQDQRRGGQEELGKSRGQPRVEGQRSQEEGQGCSWRCLSRNEERGRAEKQIQSR